MLFYFLVVNQKISNLLFKSNKLYIMCDLRCYLHSKHNLYVIRRQNLFILILKSIIKRGHHSQHSISISYYIDLLYNNVFK